MTPTASDAGPQAAASPAADTPGGGASLGRRITSGALVMVVLTGVASAMNYTSNIAFSRLLNPASYGDLTSLLALSVVVGVPAGAAQTVIAERVARLKAEGRTDQMRYFVRYALGRLGTLSLIAGLVYLPLIPAVERVFDLQAIGPAIALLPLLVLTFVLPLAQGLLQGLDRFVAFGLVMLAIAVSRLAFGVPWALAGGGSGGAIAGQAIGMAVVLIGTWWLLRDQVLSRGSGAARAGVRRRPAPRALAASAAFVAFACISNLDIVLAKVFLSSDEAGFYAALTTIEKIVIFLPASVSVVMVPNAARVRHSPEATARVLRIAALLVAATTVLAAVPAAIAPRAVIQLMFGSDYVQASSGVLPIVFAGAGLALLYLLVVYTVTIEDRRWVALLVAGVALQVVGIGLFHGSATQVAVVQACVVAVLLVTNEVALHSLFRRKR